MLIRIISPLLQIATSSSSLINIKSWKSESPVKLEMGEKESSLALKMMILFSKTPKRNEISRISTKRTKLKEESFICSKQKEKIGESEAIVCMFQTNILFNEEAKRNLSFEITFSNLWFSSNFIVLTSSIKSVFLDHFTFKIAFSIPT